MVNQTLALLAHPASAVPESWRVSVRVEKTTQALQLRYCFPFTELRLPAPVSDSGALRADDLWQHTCGELFVAFGAENAYREFNFAPSGQWAAYDFVSYRQRCERLPAIVAPCIALHPKRGEMTVTLPMDALPAARKMPRHVSLTAVLEDTDGKLSYWALAHPEHSAISLPDFHHRTGFTLEL